MPSVTAVMVTGHNPARRPLALHTVRHFTQQTYPDCELLILNQGDAPLLEEPMSRVREVLTSNSLILGALRNLAWEFSTSDLLCSWDDDDIHHVNSIAYMAQHYRGNNVVAPTNQLVAMLGSEIRFVSTMPRGYTNSMLFPRSCKCRYPEIERREDTVFFEALYQEMPVLPLDNPPHMYVRLFHGHNVWDEQHFRSLPRGKRPVTEDDLDYLSYVLPPILKLGMPIAKIRNVDLRAIRDQLLRMVKRVSGNRKARLKSRFRADLRMDVAKLKALEQELASTFKIPIIGRLTYTPSPSRPFVDYKVTDLLRLIDSLL